MATKTADGNPICSGCTDIMDMFDSPPKKAASEPKPEPEPKPERRPTGPTTYNCPKCNESYQGASCSCGFKNPLFGTRSKKKKGKRKGKGKN